MKQERLDIPAPYSKRAYIREKLRDLPERQRAREQKRKQRKAGRSDAKLDPEAQAWFEGTWGNA
jgi:hypothetical protein